MCRTLAALTIASALFAAIAAAPMLHAQDSQIPSGPMGHGMMGDGSNEGGMMSVMKMMKQMSRMMNHCNGMMEGRGGNGRPNDQWRKPATPDRHG